MFKKLAKWLKDFGGFDPKEVESSNELYAELLIDPNTGAVTTEAYNGNGQNCVALTSSIETSMGGVTKRQLKPEASRVVREPSKTRSTGTQQQRTIQH